jgi:hypothetical protein
MDSDGLVRGLEEHLRTQLRLAKDCRARALAAGDARLRSAWLGHFVRVSRAMAATGSAIAQVRHAGGAAAMFDLPTVHLPALPRLMEPEPERGTPPPAEISKQPQAEFAATSAA